MEEKVVFSSSTGTKLVGILSHSDSISQQPIVIMCHGFTSKKESKVYVQMQEILMSHNLASLRFDFFGHGESGGKFEEITVSEGVDNALSAIAFVKEKGYTKIGLFGSSFGGLVGLMVGAQSPKLFVLALKSPVSNFKDKLNVKGFGDLDDWKKAGYTYYEDKPYPKCKVNHSFVDDWENNDGYVAAETISIPTLIVHGDADKVVPVEQSKKTVGLLKNGKLEIIPGAGHPYKDPEHFKQMLKLISEFIVKHV